jgi:ubiquinone/menaquinone biosynthesis C-methylase UbiE
VEDLNRPVFARIQARAAEIEERRGGADRRRQLLRGLSGRVLEVGAGSGISFAHYPGSVAELIAIEPEPSLRERAVQAARAAPIPVRVLDGVAERIPLPDASVDTVVFAGVLCSVADPRQVLDEARRVLRPDGELRFYEHVVSRNARLRRLQSLVDATFWPRLFGGCHTTRDTETAIVASGFAIEERERLSFRPTLLAVPIAPRILGRARPS